MAPLPSCALYTWLLHDLVLAGLGIATGKLTHTHTHKQSPLRMAEVWEQGRSKTRHWRPAGCEPLSPVAHPSGAQVQHNRRALKHYTGRRIEQREGSCPDGVVRDPDAHTEKTLGWPFPSHPLTLEQAQLLLGEEGCVSMCVSDTPCHKCLHGGEGARTHARGHMPVPKRAASGQTDAGAQLEEWSALGTAPICGGSVADRKT